MVTETKDKKILKLGNWQVFLLGKLHDLYLKNEQCNISLKFDNGESIQAHRLVLSVCTTFFDHLPQVHQPVVLRMPNTMLLHHVKSIISFMYTGRLEYEVEEQEEILSTAKKLGMSVLAEMMQAQIQPSTNKKVDPTKIYKKLIHKHKPPTPLPPPEPPVPEVESSPPPPQPPPTPQGTPSSALPGKKKTPVMTAAPVDPPRPTRFEWPENNSASGSSLPYIMTSDSFEHLSYNSKVDIKPFTDPKPVFSEGNISKMPETSLTGTKRPRNSEVLKGFSCDDEDYDDGSHFEDIHDIGEEDMEDVITVAPPVITPPKPILKTVSTPTPSKKVRFSFSTSDNDVLASSSELATCPVPSTSVTSHPVTPAVVTSPPHTPPPLLSTPTPALQSTSATSYSVSTPAGSSSPIVNVSTPTTVNPKIISEILKKFPELAKSNKNIKLKIQSGPFSMGTVPNQSVYVDSEGKGAKPVHKTVQYIVVKPDAEFLKKEVKPDVLMGAENRTGPWICVSCGSEEEPKNFDTYYNYRRHLHDVHKERIDARICEHCGYKASKRNLHLYHLYTKHDIPPPRNIHFPKCDQCTYIALSESLLIKHRNQHVGMATSEYVCRLCNAAFKSNGALMGHMQTNLHVVDQATKKDYKCIYCDKVFHRNINLKAHVRTSHQMESVRRLYDDEDRIDDPIAEQEQETQAVPLAMVNKRKPQNRMNTRNCKVQLERVNANAPQDEGDQRSLQEGNENVMEVIEMPVFNAVDGANKTLFIHHPGMTILAESPSVPLLPSSESEAMSNVATGIATSINITERNIGNDVIVLERSPATYVLNQDGSYSVQEYIVPEIISDSDRVYTTALVSSASTTGITYVNSDNISIISPSDHTYADGMKLNGAQVSLVASSGPTVIASSQANQPIIIHGEPIIMSSEWVQTMAGSSTHGLSLAPGQQVEVISASEPTQGTAQNLVNDWGDLEEEEEDEGSREGEEDDDLKPSRLSVNVVCADDGTIE